MRTVSIFATFVVYFRFIPTSGNVAFLGHFTTLTTSKTKLLHLKRKVNETATIKDRYKE